MPPFSAELPDSFVPSLGRTESCASGAAILKHPNNGSPPRTAGSTDWRSKSDSKAQQ